MNPHLEAAIHYAELGFSVFPCKANSKEPATAHGCLDATRDKNQIEQWWGNNPLWNVAIATDGFMVLDVDPAGKEWLKTVDTSELMRGSVAKTPRGGLHYWFKQNGTELRNTTGKIASGIDTRANGGYVLVAPSVVDGKPYFWVTDIEPDQPTVPHWLVNLLGVRQPLSTDRIETIQEGCRNQVMIRFGGYLRRAGLCEEEILHGLKAINDKRCNPPLPSCELRSIAKNAAKYDPDYAQEGVILSHFPDTDEPVEPERSVEFPEECIATMPGVMREAYDYIIDSAIKPQPELTLGALIALFGAAFGRKVSDDYDTRTNVMILALAPSGSGKEHPRQKVKEFLLGSGMDAVNGPERIGSHAGIISSVASHPVRLFQLDEIGRLLATMRDPKASHLYNIGTVLMALYSSANTIWTGDAYADLSKVKQIKAPHVCVYGTSVPESLYSGLSPENLTDGLVGRLLVFQSLGIPDRKKPIKTGLPWMVVETLRSWNELRPEGWGNFDNGPPIVVEKTEEANQRHEEYCDDINRKHRTEDNISSSIWSRAPEKVGKLALIYACCEARDFNPIITLDAENWAIKLANYSTRLVLQAAANSVAGSKYEADLKFVFSCIDGDITANALTRRTQRLKQRERMDILIDLQAQGAIESIVETTGKRPKTIYRKRRNRL